MQSSFGFRSQSTLSPSTSAREFKVVLDNDTLYVDQPLAEALSWNAEIGTSGMPLTLSGWAPHYFAIAPSGSDSDALARATVESSRDPNVRETLKYLKDRSSLTLISLAFVASNVEPYCR
ncbi:hypothetical protein EVG20_g9595 [Dentipellis fragilis]|uniref:Uncharacterized protein n=1 Tax=Dentipellis fragilis TaxID=205917 RepID=A0A4Y9XWT3_9AGAM|nr:hypothetical protein EVG20_g9595 [Dentipellis fragilis]